MRISIRQLKRIIKEQVEESTKGGSIYDDYEDSGRDPSDWGRPRLSKEELVEMFEVAVRADGEEDYDYEELRQEILDRLRD